MKLISDTCHGCLCTTMAYLVVLGCLGTALVELLGEEVGFSVVSGSEVDLDVELTLVCVNVHGLGPGLGGAGALREPQVPTLLFVLVVSLIMAPAIVTALFCVLLLSLFDNLFFGNLVPRAARTSPSEGYFSLNDF